LFGLKKPFLVPALQRRFARGWANFKRQPG
jgi:hypothetical protein